MARPKKAESIDELEVVSNELEQLDNVENKKEDTVSKKELEKAIKEKDDMAKMLAQLQAQMIQMQAQMNSASQATEKNLPKKVKVINLLFHTLNLSTEPMGRGKLFTLRNFGDMVTMKTSDLEDILSISSYRKQAENMMFYICDKDVVEDQDLTEFYEKNINKETIEHIMGLSDDNCVEMFVSLPKKLQESIAMQMSEEIADGKTFDRNRLGDIQRRTEIDIEKMSQDVKEVKTRIKK